MDVLICTAKEQAQWRQTLAECLPEARLHAGLDAPECDYGVAWKPPAQLFGRQPRIESLFSSGTGINGLPSMPVFSRDVPRARMED